MSDFIQSKADFVAINYSLVAAFVLIGYDTLLTLRDEIEIVWGKKIRLAAMLYFVTRYVTIINLLISIFRNNLDINLRVCTHARFLLLSEKALQRCSAMMHITDCLSLLSVIGILGLLIARTWVITNCNRIVLAILGLLLLGTIVPQGLKIVLGSCEIPSSRARSLDLGHNHPPVHQNTTTDSSLEAIISSCFILALGTVVFVLTLYRTLGILKLPGGREIIRHSSLIGLLLKQGLFCYGWVFAFALTDAVLTHTLRATIATILTPIQNATAAIIICRLLMALRQRNEHLMGTLAATESIGSFRVAHRWVETSSVIVEFYEHVYTDSSVDEQSQGDTYPC